MCKPICGCLQAASNMFFATPIQSQCPMASSKWHSCPMTTYMTDMPSGHKHDTHVHSIGQWNHVHIYTTLQEAMASVPPDVVKQVNDLVQNEDMPVYPTILQVSHIRVNVSRLIDFETRNWGPHTREKKQKKLSSQNSQTSRLHGGNTSQWICSTYWGSWFLLKTYHQEFSVALGFHYS